MTDLGRLTELLPAGLQPFLTKAQALGFIPVLVGGAIRDFLLGTTAIGDWDFELHHPQGSDGLWSKLQHQLRSDYRMLPQPHGVVKAQHLESKLDFEFALPRLETYPQKESYAHSDFTSRAVFRLDFKDAARRRDFTLNAMGAAWLNGHWELWDPFDGQGAIKARELRPCHAEDFVKDPVRWVRAHRFAMKLKLKFSAGLTQLLEGMDLEQLSPHYVSVEALKSGTPFLFWNRLQSCEGLPMSFQGGLAHPDKMEASFAAHFAKLGYSNALLAGVFATNEGWHLLRPLGGKGEKEVSLWHERRELLRQLARRTPETILLDASALELLLRLTKSPHQWLKEAWVVATLTELGLEWISLRPWPEVDLAQVAPSERQLAKVMAWLKS